MTERTTPPRIDSEFAKLKKRVDAMERQLRPLQERFKPEIVFSYSGALAVSESPTWTRRESGRLMEIHARLRVAGTTQTSIAIYKNDDVALTVNIPANQLAVRTPTSIRYDADQDVLHDEITAAGDGALDLTVMHRFRY